MQFLEFLNIDPGILNILSIVLLCAVGVVILVVFSAIGNILGFAFNLVEVFVDVLQGGPVAWCGCLVFLFICIMIAFISIFALSNCGGPDPVNLCRIFG